MLNWNQRTPETAALLNPAFCGEVLLAFSQEYAQEDARGVPFPLAFLVLPLALNERVCRAMHPKPPRYLHSFFKKQPDARIGFAERVRAYNSFSRETIQFLGQRRLIEFAGGRIKPCGPSSSKNDRPDLAIHFKAARALARWFAAHDDVASIYLLWGITP